jgi:translation initiation factor 1
MTGSRLVYSSDGGRVAQPKDPRAAKRASEGPPIPQAPDDGWVRIWRVKGGRGGKTATVITGVPGGDAEVERLAVDLRRFAGAGGGVRQGAIEIQGDHRERVQQKLVQLGYRVKLAGG